MPKSPSFDDILFSSEIGYNRGRSIHTSRPLPTRLSLYQFNSQGGSNHRIGHSRAASCLSRAGEFWRCQWVITCDSGTQRGSRGRQPLARVGPGQGSRRALPWRGPGQRPGISQRPRPLLKQRPISQAKRWLCFITTLLASGQASGVVPKPLIDQQAPKPVPRPD